MLVALSNSTGILDASFAQLTVIVLVNSTGTLTKENVTIADNDSTLGNARLTAASTPGIYTGESRCSAACRSKHSVVMLRFGVAHTLYVRCNLN